MTGSDKFHLEAAQGWLDDRNHYFVAETAKRYNPVDEVIPRMWQAHSL